MLTSYSVIPVTMLFYLENGIFRVWLLLKTLRQGCIILAYLSGLMLITWVHKGEHNFLGGQRHSVMMKEESGMNTMALKMD